VAAVGGEHMHFVSAPAVFLAFTRNPAEIAAGVDQLGKV
jgi:hypothetical protein